VHIELMSSLPEAIQAHLQGQLGLSELASSIQACRREIADHRNDIATIINDVPDFLVAVERDAWTRSFSKLDQQLARAEDKFQDRRFIESFADELTAMLEELNLCAMSLREAGWSARGPSSHAGINELLFLIEKWTEEPSEERLELIDTKLDVEFARLEYQFEAYQNLPEFCALAMEQLLPELQRLLQVATQIVDLDEAELEELFAQLEEWAANFLPYDLDYLVKRYSGVPTPIPSINFALNCQMLFLEGAINEDMVDHAIGGAVEILQSASETFLEKKTLNDVDTHIYNEILSSLLNGLEELPEVESQEELQEAGKILIDLTNQFIQKQSLGEAEAGSRLDFKSEA